MPFSDSTYRAAWLITQPPSTGEFWLTDNWKGAYCRIGVQLRLRRSGGGEVLWERTIRGEEDDWVIIPNAMPAAMTTLLEKAVEEFASPAFAAAVAGQK